MVVYLCSGQNFLIVANRFNRDTYESNLQFVPQFLIYLSSWIRLYCHDFGIRYFSILPACLDISFIDLKMKYPCRTSDIMSLDLWCLLFYDRALLVWSIPYFTHFLPPFCLCPSSHGKLKQKRVWKKFLCRGFLLHCWLVISTTVTLHYPYYGIIPASFLTAVTFLLRKEFYAQPIAL